MVNRDMAVIAAFKLDRERETMRAHRRAFMQAQMNLPATVPTYAHLLEQMDTIMMLRGTYDPIRKAWEDVAQFIRIHPDMIAFSAILRTELGLTETEAETLLDDVFRAAMLLDRA